VVREKGLVPELVLPVGKRPHDGPGLPAGTSNQPQAGNAHDTLPPGGVRGTDVAFLVAVRFLQQTAKEAEQILYQQPRPVERGRRAGRGRTVAAVIVALVQGQDEVGQRSRASGLRRRRRDGREIHSTER
jgi:hypothetical protein